MSLVQPSNVDVTVDTDPGTPGNQTELRFTVSNWNTSQAVLVLAAEDHDTANDSARVSLSASGGGYAGVDGTVAVGVNDLTVIPEPVVPVDPYPSPPRAPSPPPVVPGEPNEPNEPNEPGPVAGAGLTFEGVPLEVEEGRERRFRVSLSVRPKGEVSLVVGILDNPDIAITPSGLTFGPSNWEVMQEVVVSAAEDDDAFDESAVIPVSASGGGYEGVKEEVGMSIIDNDEAALVLMEVPLEIREGGVGRFRMNLATRPSGDVEIVFAQERAALLSSADRLRRSPGLPRPVFTPENWNQPQEVLFMALDDADGADEESRLYLSASGGGYDGVRGQVPISIRDDDTRGLVLDRGSMELAEGESGYFRVRPATRPTRAVTLTVQVLSGADLEVDTDPVARGRQSTMVIEPADWNEMREVRVEALRDANDDDERAEILVQASGGDYEGVKDRIGVTVRDAGKGSAWLTRFARTVGSQAIEGIESRMDSARRRDAGVSARVAGREIEGGEVSMESLDKMRREDSDEDREDDFERERTMTLSDALSSGTSFNITQGTEAGGGVSLWGEIQASGYEGRTVGSAVDGKVNTGMLGVDYAQGDWMVGLVGMHSEGEGDLLEEGGSTGKEASLTTMIPWVAMDLEGGMRLRGAVGYGSGEMRLNRSDGSAAEGSLGWGMMNFGVRNDLIGLPEEEFGLAYTTDFLWTDIRTDEVGGWGEIEGETRRIRAGIEGSMMQRSEAGARFSQKLEAGIRHDSGDAERGWGVDVGGGLFFDARSTGLELSLKGRTLVHHQEEAVRDWGISATLQWDGDPASSRGFFVSLGNERGGAQAEGGLDALFSDDAFAGLSSSFGSSNAPRWNTKLAYGIGLGGGRTGSPYVEFASAENERRGRLGYRFESESKRVWLDWLDWDIYITGESGDFADGWDMGVGTVITIK
ncbi:hypothetical protein [Thioalkalivibrio sp. HK1]|uniref:hypothetical protein n=1 Tax=Thioalkalivibrio sp. HK1 TaxID=1469245 RepID=UPI0004B77ECA|nr:hypothetical protein [Thioalkalivibrio sp. HK1]